MNNFRQEQDVGRGIIYQFTALIDTEAVKSLAPTNVKIMAKYRTRNLSSEEVAHVD